METTYFDILLARLDLSAEPAVAMLQGSATVDPLVVLAALESVGLLEDQALDPARADRRRAVIRAARTSERTREVLQALDLSPSEIDMAHADFDDEDDLHDRFARLVALVGVARAIPERLSGRLSEALERNWAWAMGTPDRAHALIPDADALQSQLDLADDHPLHELLEAILSIDNLAAGSLVEPDWDAAWASAERWLFPPLWTEWSTKLGDAFAKLRDFLMAPAGLVPALAATGDADTEEFLLWHDENQAVVLRKIGSALQVGWAGDGDPPVDVRFAQRDQSLEPAPAPAPGTAVWWLGEPPVGPATLVFTGPSGTLRVPLGPQSDA